MPLPPRRTCQHRWGSTIGILFSGRGAVMKRPSFLYHEDFCEYYVGYRIGRSYGRETPALAGSKDQLFVGAQKTQGKVVLTTFRVKLPVYYSFTCPFSALNYKILLRLNAWLGHLLRIMVVRRCRRHRLYESDHPYHGHTQLGLPRDIELD
ncbi:hypothetical protein LZ31DRAFT_65136 [Colletotrichum somersetense]|nr:hypothetical protein LZ31DRAFT_65136 [Colletotrichum somersetense]